MALSLGIIIILGLLLNKLFERLNLPGLLGMLILGIIIGPYGINFIDQDILNISTDLRKIALIVILLRAGLGIKRETLNKVGLPALKMSIIPVVFEGITILFAASYILDISRIEAGMLGFIIAAVSPAVIVPQMLRFIERRKGEEKGIPTLILAGASIDDVIAITIFSAFVGMYGGQNVSIIRKVFEIPISIIIGIALGALIGAILVYIYKHYKIRDTKKVLILLGIAIILTSIEDFLSGVIPIASLLGVMTIGFVLLERYTTVANRMASKLNKIWVFAELLLFVLVGAQVNIYVALDAGLVGLLIIAIGLLARSIGVLISLAKTNLTWRERIFCLISYSPKATVQAAIGAIPLSYGVQSGDIILAIAVLSIIVTAPLGAIGIRTTGERWLSETIKSD